MVPGSGGGDYFGNIGKQIPNLFFIPADILRTLESTTIFEIDTEFCI